MLFILFFLGTVLANNQLESANIFICYNPNNVILNSNDCNKISSDFRIMNSSSLQAIRSRNINRKQYNFSCSPLLAARKCD